MTTPNILDVTPVADENAAADTGFKRVFLTGDELTPELRAQRDALVLEFLKTFLPGQKDEWYKNIAGNLHGARVKDPQTGVSVPVYGTWKNKRGTIAWGLRNEAARTQLPDGHGAFFSVLATTTRMPKPKMLSQTEATIQAVEEYAALANKPADKNGWIKARVKELRPTPAKPVAK